MIGQVEYLIDSQVRPYTSLVMIKQADQVSLSQESPCHVTDTPGCVRAKVWLVVDKETLSALVTTEAED